MANIKQAFGASTAVTVSIASLASSATVGRASTAVDNSSNLYLDAFVFATMALTTGTSANDKTVYLYGYGSVDGTNYTENVTGTDAAFTILDPTNLRLIGSIAAPTQSVTYKAGPFSVAAAFGGSLPTKWGVVVVNYTGIALAASGSSVIYQGVYATSV